MNPIEAARALAQPWAVTDPGYQAARKVVEAAKVAGSWDDGIYSIYRFPVRRKSGVAVLPVRGVLWERGFWGMSGYDTLTAALQEFLEAPLPVAIVLAVDSPGGVCSGGMEFCQALRAARDVVPLFAVVDREACSMGYQIASQASQIIMAPDGLAGSIGTKISHWDMSASFARDGVTVENFYRGRYKMAGDEKTPTSAETRETLQHLADRYFDQFVEAVTLGRPSLSPTDVIATEARIYHGSEAVDVGLADDLGTLTELLALLEG